jgi:hypothetical protein
MQIDERHLGIVLQACLDFARRMLEENGGFLPFGARAKRDGEVEFLQAGPENGEESLDALSRRIGMALADDARQGGILAAALVANASLPEGADGTYERAVSVLIEAPEFCRSIVVPYRIGGSGGRATVEFAKMIPEEADPVVYAG